MLGGQNSVGFGDQYFFVARYLETGDGRYEWVNRTQFLGQGRLSTEPNVEYRVFRVDN